MNKSNLRYFACMALFFCLAAVQVAAQQNSSFNLTMSLQNVKTKEAIVFTGPIQSTTGEQFRLAIQPSAASYIYVIAESESNGGNDNDVAVFFDGPLKGGETWYSGNIILDPPRGTVFLYVIASMNEEKGLADIIKELKSKQQKKEDDSRQRRLLRAEVDRIKSRISKFLEVPGIPVLMGGAVRGSEEQRAVQFSGMETYVRVISIEH